MALMPATARPLMSGLRELEAQLQQLPEITKRAIAHAQIQTASVIVREASRAVRRRTQALADAIGFDQDERIPRTRIGIRRGKFRGVRPGPRAHLIEFGTRRAPAYPFILPAVEGERANYLARLKDAGRDVERAMSVRHSSGGGLL